MYSSPKSEFDEVIESPFDYGYLFADALDPNDRLYLSYGLLISWLDCGKDE